jgi:S-adenosylmethionine:tRNA ribosyltransferase-isomerase
MLGAMRTSDFDFVLPPDLIAQEPAEPRDAGRLMVLDPARPSANSRRSSARATSSSSTTRG